MNVYKIAAYCIIGFLVWCVCVLLGAGACVDVNNSGLRGGLVIGSAVWCVMALLCLARWLFEKGQSE